MELNILDKDFNIIDIIDSYISLIWPIQYNKAGEFELYLQFHPLIARSLKVENYLYLRGSGRHMIIKDFWIEDTPEDGYFISVKGESLEEILRRRIVWSHTVLTGSLQDAIEQLLNENLINPSDSNRKIDNFIFEPSTNPDIIALEIDTQYHGEDLYDIITGLCETERIGFSVTLNDDNKFVFKLYKGEDRSYDQLQNPYVIFSNKFENLTSGTYNESSVNYRNIGLVGGEGEGDSRIVETAYVDDIPTGLNRREVFIDGSQVSTDGSLGFIDYDDYLKQLKEKGIEELSTELKLINQFDGVADVSKTFQYGKDFEVGDIVQLENELGYQAKTRVTEVIFVQDMSGYNVYPTFEVIDD